MLHNSISGLCVTKLDVLDGLDTIRICTGYRIDGEIRENPPLSAASLRGSGAGLRGDARLERADRRTSPSLRACRRMRARYLARMEELAGVPIDIVSTGADRAETIVLRHPFD